MADHVQADKTRALVGNVPELSPNNKKSTSPAIAMANPNSDNFQINLLSDVI